MRVTVLALAAALLWGSTASAQIIGGRYTVSGANPNGSTYGGTVEISPTGGNTCRISWSVGTEWQGICMMSEKTFAASYRSGKTYGLLIYELQPSGVLKGLWSIADGNGTGTEILTPVH
jgi:hypothetical protein